MLWRDTDSDGGGSVRQAPECFGDLNLDQVVATIIAGRDGYDLRPSFHAPLRDVDAVAYRHEVFADLQVPELRQCVDTFARAMRHVREQRVQAAALLDARQRRRLHLDAAFTYYAAVEGFARDLSDHHLDSRGLRAFGYYLRDHVGSAGFREAHADAERVSHDLAALRYRLVLDQDGFTVSRDGDEAGAALGLKETFARFERKPSRQRLTKAADDLAMNKLESAIQERVAWLYPEAFAALDEFTRRRSDFIDAGVARFDREVQFYLAYLDYVRYFERGGLAFCLPEVSSSEKSVEVRAAFDPALAYALIANRRAVVPNDVVLSGRERLFVVTGANQGGKTTFARMFGQLHYLASLGCPIPGTRARLFLCDEVLTHFDREEDLEELRGKLQDELMRIRGLLERASPRSVVIMNEAFTSTTAHDALYLGRNVLGRLLELDALGVWVTFIDELASLDPAVVSLVSNVDPEDSARRTFELARRPADGRAHAEAIARAHRLTYAELRERLAP